MSVGRAKKRVITEEEVEEVNKTRELEQFYSENKVDNMLERIEEEKERITKEMIEYANKHTEAVKWTRDGDIIAEEVKINPLVVSNYFFKPIISIGSVEPEYNAEKLALVFDYYCYLITEVNDKIGKFPSSLTSFCKLAGITLSTLRNYRNSADMNMRIIAEKIYDQIGDTNITMSQLGMLNEKTTIFKMKAQNEIFEKEQPKVHINIIEQPDLEQITNRINKYKNFATKKGNN